MFSEVTSRSFRTSWTATTTSALSYLVRFRKAEDTTGNYISLAVPADTTTAVLPHLFPLTAYEVNVFAQYDKGDSFPLTGEETTLEGNGFVFMYLPELNPNNIQSMLAQGTGLRSSVLFISQNKEPCVT